MATKQPMAPYRERSKKLIDKCMKTLMFGKELPEASHVQLLELCLHQQQMIDSLQRQVNDLAERTDPHNF